MFRLLASTNSVTSLLGHENQLYVGTLHGIVEVYDSESGDLLLQLSLHAGKVSRMLKLPAEVHQCICAELLLMANDECVLSESEASQSYESMTPPKRVLQERLLQQDSNLPPVINGKVHPFTSKLQPSLTDPQCIKAPLIISLGSGMADWLSTGSTKEAYQPHLLTWSGYGNIYL